LICKSGLKLETQFGSVYYCMTRGRTASSPVHKTCVAQDRQTDRHTSW